MQRLPAAQGPVGIGKTAPTGATSSAPRRLPFCIEAASLPLQLHPARGWSGTGTMHPVRRRPPHALHKPAGNAAAQRLPRQFSPSGIKTAVTGATSSAPRLHETALEGGNAAAAPPSLRLVRIERPHQPAPRPRPRCLGAPSRNLRLMPGSFRPSAGGAQRSAVATFRRADAIPVAGGARQAAAIAQPPPAPHPRARRAVDRQRVPRRAEHERRRSRTAPPGAFPENSPMPPIDAPQRTSGKRAEPPFNVNDYLESTRATMNPTAVRAESCRPKPPSTPIGHPTVNRRRRRRSSPVGHRPSLQLSGTVQKALSPTNSEL